MEVQEQLDFGTMMMRAGDLKVSLRKAEGIKGDDAFGWGKADPYAILVLGSKSQANKREKRSNIHKGAGGDPVWNQEFVFHLHYAGYRENILYIYLYDKDRYTRDDLLGKVKIDLAQVLAEKGDEVPYSWYSVFYKKKPRGKVELALSFQETIAQPVLKPSMTKEGVGSINMTTGARIDNSGGLARNYLLASTIQIAVIAMVGAFTS